MSKEKLTSPIKRRLDSRENNDLLELKNQFLSPSKRSDHIFASNDNKHRVNLIKINKAKLPPDFFPKSSTIEKKLPKFKLGNSPNQRLIPTERPKRVQSQRLHNSPQKVSLFGLFEPDCFTQNMSSSKTLAIRRKFQTREEPKRDNSQMKRRFTPGSKIHRNQLVDIFPSSYENNEIMMTSISSRRMQKISPRKQYHYRFQQLVHDPQKYDRSKNTELQPRSLINLKSIEQSDQNGKIEENNFVYCDAVDLHNMTFFNAKSSCLPPIKKS